MVPLPPCFFGGHFLLNYTNLLPCLHLEAFLIEPILICFCVEWLFTAACTEVEHLACSIVILKYALEWLSLKIICPPLTHPEQEHFSKSEEQSGKLMYEHATSCQLSAEIIMFTTLWFCDSHVIVAMNVEGMACGSLILL